MPGKLLMELPRFGNTSIKDQFAQVFGERTPDFEAQEREERMRSFLNWSYEDYLEDCRLEGRAVRYSKEKFEELKEFSTRGV